jgi:excisionase family DNA binding protein
MTGADYPDSETGLDAWYGNQHGEFSTHLSTTEAGKLMGLAKRTVCLHIKSGRLPAIRMGRDWFVDARDAKLFEKRPSGRPTKAERFARQRRDHEFNRRLHSSDLLVARSILLIAGVPLLSTAEVAKVLNVSPSRVRQLVMGRRLKPHRHGSRTFFSPDQVETVHEEMLAVRNAPLNPCRGSRRS